MVEATNFRFSFLLAEQESRMVLEKKKSNNPTKTEDAESREESSKKNRARRSRIRRGRREAQHLV